MSARKGSLARICFLAAFSVSPNLVHCVRSDPFHDALLAALTAGRFQAVRKAQASSATLAIAPDSRDICEAFAGLSISAPDLANEWVFSGGNDSECRKLITLGDDAFFAIFSALETEILLLGSRDVIDLDAEARGCMAG